MLRTYTHTTRRAHNLTRTVCPVTVQVVRLNKHQFEEKKPNDHIYSILKSNRVDNNRKYWVTICTRFRTILPFKSSRTSRQIMKCQLFRKCRRIRHFLLGNEIICFVAAADEIRIECYWTYGTSCIYSTSDFFFFLPFTHNNIFIGALESRETIRILQIYNSNTYTHTCISIITMPQININPPPHNLYIYWFVPVILKYRIKYESTRPGECCLSTRNAETKIDIRHVNDCKMCLWCAWKKDVNFSTRHTSLP